MTAPTDSDDPSSFVLSLPRRLMELRATLGTLVADTRSQRMRSELRRRLEALEASSASHGLSLLSEGLREARTHLDLLRATDVLTTRDLETLSDSIAALAGLARRDLPDRPDLFERTRPVTGPRAPVTAAPRAVDTPAPASTNPRSVGSAAADAPVPAPAPAPTSPAPSTPTRALGASLHVLFVGRDGEPALRAALDADAELVAVRSLADALAQVAELAPDVIVAETASPADGASLVGVLRRDPLTDFYPVVLVTSPSERLRAEGLRAEGAFDVVELPRESARLGSSVVHAAESMLSPGLPPAPLGEVTLEDLTRTLQDEIRRGLLGAAGPSAGASRVPIGPGGEVLAATWEAIARVREVVARQTHGRIRFERPAAPLGIGGAHVLAVGDEDDVAVEPDGEDPLLGRIAFVVDDDPRVVEFFSGLLRGAGMRVIERSEGLGALRDARAARPDLVIADILMPGMDGFSLCRAIRRDVALRHVPVVLLSWREDLLHRMRELGAQAQGFLRKEARGEAILARVRGALRARSRVQRRVESLGEADEVRGRLEAIGAFSLLECAARAPDGVTVTITDVYSVTELELREGRLVSALRTAQDGSLSRGETALAFALGTSSARFSVKRSSAPSRPNLDAPLDALLSDGAARITAVEDAVSGASIVEVAALEVDRDASLAFAQLLTDSQRALVQRICDGDSPRDLVLRGGVTPQELDPILVELARRGCIRAARGGNGEDLVTPRLEARRDAQRASSPDVRVSSVMPAILQPATSEGVGASGDSLGTEDPDGFEDDGVPVFDIIESRRDSPVPSPRPAGVEIGQLLMRVQDGPPASPLGEGPTPARPAEPVAPTPEERDAKPATMEPTAREPEAAREVAAEPLASGEPVSPQREVSGERPTAPRTEDEQGEEPSLPLRRRSRPSIDPVWTSTPEPVQLDARGLPRQRTVDEEPPRAATGSSVSTSNDSIIVDVSAVGGPVEVSEPARRPQPEPTRPSWAGPATWWLGLLVAVIGLGFASYFAVRALLPPPAVAPSDAPTPVRSAGSPRGIEGAPSPSEPSVIVTSPVETAPPAGEVEQDAGEVERDAGEGSPSSAGIEGDLDPTPFLDGGALSPDVGLLAVEGPGRVTVGAREVGDSPLRVELAPGQHNLTYRRGNVRGFRVIEVRAGRAVRLSLPDAP
jgi:CheY-like chemotaxis protein